MICKRLKSINQSGFVLLTFCLLVDGLQAAALIKDFIYQEEAFLGVGNECELNDGGTGTCLYDTDCPWLVHSGAIHNNEVKYCSFVGKNPVVCCKNKSVKPLTSITHFSVEAATSLTSNACQNYLDTSDILQDKIRNGTPANVGEFPHMVALFRRSDEIGQDLAFVCGGSIISDRYILTAAHCVNSNRLSPNNPVIVRVGQINIANNNEDIDMTDFGIENIIRHENYDPVTNFHDIALIRLNTSILFSEKVFPACLREDISDVNPAIPLTATGWGLTENFTPSDILLKANLTSVSLEQCNVTLLNRNQILNSRRLEKGLIDGQMCAVDPEATKDTCEGDSGGPIQIPHQKGLSLIVGITSFGQQCANGMPSVYTRVANYITWIERHVNWNELPPPLFK